MGLFAPIVKAPPKGSTPFVPRTKAASSVSYTVLTPAQQAAIAPMTGTQIQQDAASSANQQIQGQVQPLLDQQASQNAAAASQAKATAAYNAAVSKLLGTIGPQSQAGYNQAAQETSQLAQGFSAPLQATLTDEQAQQAQQAQALGATGQNAPQQVDPSAFGDTLKMGNGFIPSSNLLAQGAHANQWGQGLKAVNTDVGRSMLQTQATNNAAANATITNKIAEVAAKYPQLFTAQEHADIAANTAKVNAGIKGTLAANTINASNAHITYETEQAATAQLNANNRATIATNNYLLSQDRLNEKTNYDNANIQIKGAAANNALLKIEQTGQQVDKNSSMIKGYIVLKNGSVPTVKGQVIPVDPRSYGSTSTSNSPTVQYSKAVKSATAMIGSPVQSTQFDQTIGGGKYLLDPALVPNTAAGDVVLGKAAGVPATTNNPARAQKGTTTTFAQAVTRIMGEYPLLTRAKARAAVVAAGFKPDGQRPATTDATGPKATGADYDTSSIGGQVVATAVSQLGQPYLYGGLAKLGHETDCSGLLQESLAAHGVAIPRTTFEQWKVGSPVSANDLQPGDAVFFRGSDGSDSSPGHVGIYIGNGQYINDPHTGGVVSIRSLDFNGTGYSTYVGARRYTNNTTARA